MVFKAAVFAVWLWLWDISLSLGATHHVDLQDQLQQATASGPCHILHLAQGPRLLFWCIQSGENVSMDESSRMVYETGACDAAHDGCGAYMSGQ